MKRISSVIAVLLTSGVVLSGAVFSDAAPVNVGDATPATSTVNGINPLRDLNLRPIPIDTSAAAMLKRDVNWITAAQKCWDKSIPRGLEFTGSYTQKKNSLVGYVRGILRLKDGVLSGEGTQYFNDRTWEKPSPPPVPGTPNFHVPQNNPFNPDATDKLGLTIDPATGKAKIILLSWGGGTTEIQLEYKNGVFYGFQSNGGMHAFVFKRIELSCPPK